MIAFKEILLPNQDAILKETFVIDLYNSIISLYNYEINQPCFMELI